MEDITVYVRCSITDDALSSERYECKHCELYEATSELDEECYYVKVDENDAI